jgi:hypothetical protein
MSMKEAKEYKIEDQTLICPICKHNRFYYRRTLMSTAGKTFFNVDWVNPEATNYICEKCRHVMWFFFD